MTNDDKDTDMEFFRIVHKQFEPLDEVRIGIRAALELAFGADGPRVYGRGIVGWTEGKDGA